MGNGELAGGKDRGEIGAYHVVPLLDRHILQQTDVGDPGIVDENVHTGKSGADFRIQLFYVRVIRDIADAGVHRNVTAVCQLRCQLLQRIPGAAAVENERTAFRCEGVCECATDAAGSACDQCGFCHGAYLLGNQYSTT